MGRELVARLPESVQEIAEVIGRDKALEFIGKLPVSGSRSWRVCVYTSWSSCSDGRMPARWSTPSQV